MLEDEEGIRNFVLYALNRQAIDKAIASTAPNRDRAPCLTSHIIKITVTVRAVI